MNSNALLKRIAHWQDVANVHSAAEAVARTKKERAIALLTKAQRAFGKKMANGRLDEGWLSAELAKAHQWLTRWRQPKNAVVSQHGIGTIQGGIAITARPPNGHNVTFTFKARGDHAPSLTTVEKKIIRLTLERQFGHGAVVGSWCGTGWMSVAVTIEKASPSLLRAFERYCDGCPSCDSIFCKKPSHEWNQGFKALQTPEGWR